MSFFQVPIGDRWEEVMNQMEIFSMHSSKKMLNRVTKAIAGSLQINFRLSYHRIVLGEFDEPSEGLECG